jgi:hypothetical protein
LLILKGESSCDFDGKKVHGVIPKRVNQWSFAVPKRSAQAKKAQNNQNDDHDTDDINDTVHCIPICETGVLFPPTPPTISHRFGGWTNMDQCAAEPDRRSIDGAVVGLEVPFLKDGLRRAGRSPRVFKSQIPAPSSLPYAPVVHLSGRYALCEIPAVAASAF